MANTPSALLIKILNDAAGEAAVNYCRSASRHGNVAEVEVYPDIPATLKETLQTALAEHNFAVTFTEVERPLYRLSLKEVLAIMISQQKSRS